MIIKFLIKFCLFTTTLFPEEIPASLQELQKRDGNSIEQEDITIKRGSSVS
jgi:hypothetical protein